MSWAKKAVERENEILRMIELLGRSGIEFVLLGGYAVSAMGRHRFSIDCDIVVPKSSLPRIEQMLAKEGYEKGVERHDLDDVYGGEFVSFGKKVGELPVTVDLLVASLVCRQTGAAWSYDYIKENSSRGVVAGIERSAEASALQKELLVAFKVHSGRETDLRDVVMLSRELDFAKVRKHAKRGNKSKLNQQIEHELNLLADSRFLPSLKGVFEIRGDVSKEIARTRAFLERLKEELVLSD